jgi:hypothetical protein
MEPIQSSTKPLSLIMSAKRFISAGVLCGFQFHDVVDGLSIVVCPPICCVEAFPS